MGETVSSSLIVEGRNVIATEVVEGAVAERPGHDTIENIIEWLRRRPADQFFRGDYRRIVVAAGAGGNTLAARQAAWRHAAPSIFWLRLRLVAD